MSPSAPLLELRDITVRGRGAPRLDRISLRVWAGERVAVLGPSGAGKSTLLAVANGLLLPDAGAVLWEGRPPSRSRRARRLQQARIGTLWQDLRLIEPLSVQQNLNAARLAVWGWPRALLNLLLPIETAANAAALAQVDLGAELLNQPVAVLSGGQRQRVAIARLLRQDARLLLADEPLSNLDPRLAAELLELLQRQVSPSEVRPDRASPIPASAPRALLLSLHRPDLLAGFDRVIGLRAGRLLFDHPASALAAPNEAATSLRASALEGLYRGSEISDTSPEGSRNGPPAGPGFR